MGGIADKTASKFGADGGAVCRRYPIVSSYPSPMTTRRRAPLRRRTKRRPAGSNGLSKLRLKMCI